MRRVMPLVVRMVGMMRVVVMHHMVQRLAEPMLRLGRRPS
jgi:hypothetical protein